MHSHPMIRIPALEDSTSVLLAIDQVMRLLVLETMDTKRAGLMLYGLQIASSVIQNREQARPEDYVRSVHDEAGNPIDFSEALICETPVLAPESTVCEPPQDCAECEQNTSCNKLAKLQKENADEELCNNGMASDRPQVKEGKNGLQKLRPGAPSKPLPDTPHPDTLSAAWVGNIEPPPNCSGESAQTNKPVASQQASWHDFTGVPSEPPLLDGVVFSRPERTKIRRGHQPLQSPERADPNTVLDEGFSLSHRTLLKSNELPGRLRRR
jgi:hypothetical protein